MGDPVPRTGAPRGAARAQRRKVALVGGIAALVAVGLAPTAAGQAPPSPAGEALPTTFSNTGFAAIDVATASRLNLEAPRIFRGWSPGASRVSYVTGEGTWILSVPDGVPRLVSPLRSESVWSPDGRRLAFLAGRDIRLVDVETGAVQSVRIRAKGTVSLAAWSPDSARILGYTREIPFQRKVTARLRAIDLTSGEVATSPLVAGHSAIWSPDSRRVAYYFSPVQSGYSTSKSQGVRIWTVAGKKMVAVPRSRNMTPLVWRAPDRLFVQSDESVLVLNPASGSRSVVAANADPRGDVWVNPEGTEIRWVWQARAMSSASDDDRVFVKSSSGEPAAQIGTCPHAEAVLGSFSVDGAWVATRCFLHGG